MNRSRYPLFFPRGYRAFSAFPNALSSFALIFIDIEADGDPRSGNIVLFPSPRG